jgi:quinol monooxygenase YgiN
LPADRTAASGSESGDRPGAGEALCVIAVWTVDPSRASEVAALLGELATRSLTEPGCRRFDVLHASDRPGRFVLIEEYTDDAARAAHRETEYFRRLVLEGAVPLGVDRDVQVYVPLFDPPSGR